MTAAIFDSEGDVKHELAFTAAVDNINNINNWLLPGIILEPEIIKIPLTSFVKTFVALHVKLTN